MKNALDKRLQIGLADPLLNNSKTSSLSPQHALLGTRTKRGDIDPNDVLQRAKSRIQCLKSESPQPVPDLQALKKHFAEDCRLYYTLAAVSRRRALIEESRLALLELLFPFRTALERSILASLPWVGDQSQLWKSAVSKSFFGVSSKQGVSIRFGLSSCVPSEHCAGRCYGHDGRDRELHMIFRSVLSQFVGMEFEDGDEPKRMKILQSLSDAIDHGIASARKDASVSLKERNFHRSPRIRFSHIGEMAHTPTFTNAIAAEIRRRAPDVVPVIYTRHQRAVELDTNLFIVNFTIEGERDKRLKYAPSLSRLVSSSWDGRLTSIAEVNFLEHHVEKSATASGKGKLCPVTVDHSLMPSCDSAKCDLCFTKLTMKVD